MTPDIHIATVRSCLRAARQMFSDGEPLLGSEMMWGAAMHSVNAVAMRRGWNHGKYVHKMVAVERLAAEYADNGLIDGFLTARRQLHPNFDKGFLSDVQLQNARQVVERFVVRMLEIFGTGS